DQIKEMTRKVSAEVDLVHQQTQNQRYGSSHIGATAKDISNVVTDAASGVVDIFHGIDKAVADTWNNYRSEERFSRNAETDLVCRLLLEKKKVELSRSAPHPPQRRDRAALSQDALLLRSLHPWCAFR